MALSMEIKDIDRQVYEEELQPFLPEEIFDIHTHVWLAEQMARRPVGRVVSWPALVASENPIEEHLECYRRIFPGKRVRSLMFSNLITPETADRQNSYIREVSRSHDQPALLFALPEWSALELERRVIDGGFVGIKVYLNLAPAYLPRQEIRIYDFLPPHQIEVMDQHGWIVMLHIPRDGRLRDPVNLAQMMEIEQRYRKLQLIIAHVGRAYCNEDVGDAFDVLKDTERMNFDFSANTNDWVFEQLIRTVGPERILFGSDLPIVRMRMRRICEGGMYINIVPKGLYGDVSADKNMREADGAEAERLTFFLYEELRAFRRAAERTGLDRDDLQLVFHKNAEAMLRRAGWDRG